MSRILRNEIKSAIKEITENIEKFREIIKLKTGEEKKEWKKTLNDLIKHRDILKKRIKKTNWSFEEYKQNRIDSASNWNNTNDWTKAHPVKPKISFIGWVKSVIRCAFAGKPKYEVLETKELDFNF